MIDFQADSTRFVRDISNYDPPGHLVMIKVPRVRIELDAVYRLATNAGLVLSEAVKLQCEEKRRQVEYGADTGTVYKVGPQAWRDFGDGSPWCDVGDEVIFRKHAGSAPPDQDPEKDFYYRVLNDNEICLVLRKRT